MRNILFLFAAIVLLNSCATVLNGPYTKVKVHVRPREVVTYTNDSGQISTAAMAADDTRVFSVPRGKRQIDVTITGDTAQQSFLLRPTESWVFYLNLLQPYALGMFIDIFNPKRYSYPANIYPSAKAKKGYVTIPRLKRRDVSLTFMPPLVQSYLLGPATYDFSGNVLGTGIGANYSYNDKCFFSAEGVAAIAWITYQEPYYENSNNATRMQHLTWVTLAARHQHVLGRFDLGYGLSSAWQHCNEKYDYGSNAGNSETGLVRQDDFFTLGGSFSANYRLSTAVYAGICYQPHLLSLTANGAVLAYSQMFNAGFFWRIPLSKLHN